MVNGQFITLFKHIKKPNNSIPQGVIRYFKLHLMVC